MQQSVTPVEQQAFISFHASHLFRGNDKNKNSHIKRAPFIILFGLAYILQLRRGACASRQIKKDASFFYCLKLLIFICYFNPHSLSYLPSFIISFWFFKCPNTNQHNDNKLQFCFLAHCKFIYVVLNVFEKYISLSLVRIHDTNFQTHSQFYGLICKVTQLKVAFFRNCDSFFKSPNLQKKCSK